MAINPDLLLSTVLVGNVLAIGALVIAVLGWLHASDIERSLGLRLSSLEADRNAERNRRQTAEDQVAALQSDLGKALLTIKRKADYRDRLNAVEAIQVKAVRALEEHEVSANWLRYIIGLCVHINAGGNPDAKPTEWLGEALAEGADHDGR